MPTATETDEPQKAEDFLGPAPNAEDFLGENPGMPADWREQVTAMQERESGQPSQPPVPVPGGYLPVQPSEVPQMEANRTQAELRQGHGKPMLTKFRESLSPFLGETALQRLNRPPGALENIDTTGLLPALSKPAVKIPRFTPSPGDSKAAAVAKAAFNVAAGIPEFFESPMGAATGGIGTTSKIAGRAIAGGFAADMASQVPEEAREAGKQSVTGNTQQKAEAILGLASQIGMSAALAVHAATGPKEPPGGPPARPQAELPPELAAAENALPRTAQAAKQAIAEESPTKTTKTEVPDASSEQKAAEVHGDMRAPTGEGPGSVPVEEGGGGVLPQTVGGLPEANAPRARPETREVVLTPAVRHEGKIYEAKPGQKNHGQIKLAEAKNGNDILEGEHGFMFEGQFIDRAKAAEIFKQSTGKDPSKPGELHSEDLNAAGMLKHLDQPVEPSPLEQKLSNPDTFTGKDWTKDAYTYATDATPEQLTELSALEKKYSDEMTAIPKTIENFAKIGEIGKRKQWATEALRFRRAVDEARAAGVTTDAELAAIAKKHGVGAGRGEDDAAYAKDLKEGLAKSKAAEPEVVDQTVNKVSGSTPPASPTASEGQPAPTVTPPAGRKQSGGSWTKWSYHPSGANDILDDIFEEGGIATPSHSKFATKGDYDGYKSAFGTGMAVRLRRSSGGLRPDDMMQALEQRGHRFESTSDFYDAVEKAAKERQGLEKTKDGLTPRETKELKTQQVQAEDFQGAVLEGKGAANPPVKAGDVVKKPGDTFTVQGQKFRVRSYDPESDTYEVEDGQRFGRQYLSGEETIHPDPTTPKLRTGEKGTGELLQGEDQPFNLAGDQGTDADRIAAQKAQAEKDAAEAKAKQDREQQGFQGMGGAVPAEFEHGAGTPTSIKNAVVDQERAKRGLPPAMQPLRRSFGDVWDKAMAQIDNDPAWLYGDKHQPGLIEELKRKPRALTDEEDAALLYHQIDLQNEYGKARREQMQHFEDGNAGMAQEAKLRGDRLSDDLLDLYNIGKQAGTETGRGLNARKMMAMEDFTLAKMELDKRAANGGRRLTEDESAELARMHARIAETQKRLDEHMATSQARIAELEVKAALDRVKLEAQARMDPVIKRIVTRIGDALHSQRDAALARIKARGTRLMAGIDPQDLIDYSVVGASHLFDGALDFAQWSEKMVSDFTEAIKPHLDKIFVEANKRFDEQVDAAAGKKRAPAVKKAVRDPAERAAGLADQIGAKVKDGKRNQITMLVQRLARTFVERGVDDRDELIDRVHGVLSKFMPDMTRREAMDAISGYGDFRQLTKSAISVELRDLKGQMQQVAKLEDMQAGIPPSKTGLERRVPSAEESRLIKAVNDAKRQFQIPVDDPNTQLKSALDTLKTRLRNRTAELQEKIANGDFAPKQRRELRLDAEALRLKAENERAKEEFRRNVMKDRMRQRSGYEKVADAWVKIRRAFILSAPTTLAKLTSAAVQRMAITPAEELAGAGYSSLFPAIAKRAAREGGISTRAEARALTEGFTKGMKDAWQVLKTGRSDLDVLYGKDKGYPIEWINLMGNIHGALKTVAKRNEFARSLQKRVESAMNGGVDVSDPMVQTRLALDAYKDANRAIFQQDNRVVSAYKRALSALDEPAKATGHVPLGRKVAGMTARTLLPIVKIPTNIVAETFQYATGLVTGSARLAKAYHDGIANLKPEEADLIMRQLKKGSLGTAVLLLGYFSPHTVGGYYQQSEKRKKGDVKPGTVRVFGHDIPSFILHNPLLEALQIGATVRRVADSKLKKRDKDTQGIAAGVWAGGLGLAEEVPFVRETTEVSKAFNPRERGQFVGELGRSLLVPQAVQWIAQHTDKDAKGNLIARKPKTAIQRIEVGIPGMREQVPKTRPQPQP